MNCPPPVSDSIIPDDLAASRIDKFLNGKFNILNDWLQTVSPGATASQSMQYAPGQFVYLVNLLASIPNIFGVKVYFAVYFPQPPATDPYLPNGMAYLLTVIFAATDSNYIDTGDYFTIDPTQTLPTPSVKKFPDGRIPQSWIDYYLQNNLPLLQADGQITNPDFLETKAIFYPLDYFMDWANIINCSGQPGNPVITGVDWSFATYLDDEDYPNQLGEVIALEEGDSMNSKKEYGKEVSLTGGGGSYDTGSPCPPDDVCN
jgi:hypothetical protein